MPDGPIDENLGVIVKFVKKSGIEVYMYKSEPGIYRTRSGDLIDKKIAFEAGFRVEELDRQKVIQERKAAALADIEDEFSISVEEKVLVSRGGYKAIRVGPATRGRYVIRDPEGKQITADTVDKKEAYRLISKLAPKEEDTSEESSEKTATG